MKIRNSCIVDTVYGLALYFLYMPLPEIYKTRFFVGSNIPTTVDNQLKNVVRIDTADFNKKISPVRFAKFWILCAYYHFTHIIFTRIYGQDHIGIFGLLCGLKNYSLLEDAPGVFTRLPTHSQYLSLNTKRTRTELLLYILRFGMLPSSTFGQGRRCKNIIITSLADTLSPLLKRRNYELVNIDKMWKESNQEKQQLISDVFGITSKMISEMSHCETLFITQPYRDDLVVTDAEWSAIVEMIVARYPGDLLIKSHPRDRFDYKKHFPGVKLFDLPIPMQLLSVLGVVVKRVVTINSSAIHSFPASVEKVVLGASVNAKIADYCNSAHG